MKINQGQSLLAYAAEQASSFFFPSHIRSISTATSSHILPLPLFDIGFEQDYSSFCTQ